MTETTAFIAELIEAANKIHLLRADERRRLIERGIAVVNAQQELLGLNGNIVALTPAFLKDMPMLVVMAEREDAVETIVGAGMLMLAGEIRRLRILLREAGQT